jgi:hypothetical protein
MSAMKKLYLGKYTIGGCKCVTCPDLYYVPGNMLTRVFLQIKKGYGKTIALCKQCHEKEAEMTSFECYNMRVANPKAHLVFYDNFFKIAAGQACWKENMENGAERNLKAFATPAVEAFALLCLENNEQDWLHEAKVLRGAE